MTSSVFVITGVSAAGKSTVADLLARRFERGVHVRGDLFRKMVVAGRAEMTPELTSDALAQLDLRQRLATTIVDEYWRAGFDVAVQDVLIGPALPEFVERLTATPVHVVVLIPSRTSIAAREAQRSKTGYGAFTIDDLCDALDRETPRIGLWLDTSDLTADETVDEILRRRDEARVR